MAISLFERIKNKMVKWLMHDSAPRDFPLSDFSRILFEVRPCDVLLTEGRSRVAEVIKLVTQSPWSHAVLYIGRLHDIENPILRTRVKEFYDGDPNEHLIIESILGKGTVISPLKNLERDHIRICRPSGISHQDAQQVIGYSIGRLGREYGVRHNLDLARFLFPWTFMPRRWRSSLFQRNVGTATTEICSSMLAEAFSSINFPILPVVKKDKTSGVQFYRRNPKLYVPSDFDYSPYFEIIKYPFFEISGMSAYRNLPWNKHGFVSIDDNEIARTQQEAVKKKAIDESSRAEQESNEKETNEDNPDSSEETPAEIKSTAKKQSKDD